MSTWRRWALELLPERSFLLTEPETSVYEAFTLTLEAFEQAVVQQDERRIRACMEFGVWGLWQRAEHVWNAAGVCFWEHVFDVRGSIPLVAPLLPSSAVRDVWGLWEHRLSRDDLNLIQATL